MNSDLITRLQKDAQKIFDFEAQNLLLKEMERRGDAKVVFLTGWTDITEDGGEILDHSGPSDGWYTTAEAVRITEGRNLHWVRLELDNPEIRDVLGITTQTRDLYGIKACRWFWIRKCYQITGSKPAGVLFTPKARRVPWTDEEIETIREKVKDRILPQ
jgi:hypothetical protein